MRFEREAKAIAALNHPNICQIYDVGPNYLVMEFNEGSPLNGPLPPDQALRDASQICDTLDAAHKKDIIRCAETGNILCEWPRRRRPAHIIRLVRASNSPSNEHPLPAMTSFLSHIDTSVLLAAFVISGHIPKWSSRGERRDHGHLARMERIPSHRLQLWVRADAWRPDYALHGRAMSSKSCGKGQ